MGWAVTADRWDSRQGEPFGRVRTQGRQAARRVTEELIPVGQTESAQCCGAVVDRSEIHRVANDIASVAWL
jgi:hypothetical protein